MLRPSDTAALAEFGLSAETTVDGGFVTVRIDDFPVPLPLVPQSVSLLLRLPMGFPDATPDMFWVDPPVRGPTGGQVAGTELIEVHAGRNWQRWSRHIQGHWRPGVDNLATYLAYVRRCLALAADAT